MIQASDGRIESNTVGKQGIAEPIEGVTSRCFSVSSTAYTDVVSVAPTQRDMWVERAVKATGQAHESRNVGLVGQSRQFTNGLTALLNHVGNGLAEVCGGCLPADVRRARTFNEYGFDRVHDSLCCIGMAKMLEHHRTRPDLTDWIGDVLAIDVRRRAMNRLEQ